MSQLLHPIDYGARSAIWAPSAHAKLEIREARAAHRRARREPRGAHTPI